MAEGEVWERGSNPRKRCRLSGFQDLGSIVDLMSISSEAGDTAPK